MGRPRKEYSKIEDVYKYRLQMPITLSGLIRIATDAYKKAQDHPDIRISAINGYVINKEANTKRMGLVGAFMDQELNIPRKFDGMKIVHVLIEDYADMKTKTLYNKLCALWHLESTQLHKAIGYWLNEAKPSICHAIALYCAEGTDKMTDTERFYKIANRLETLKL